MTPMGEIETERQRQIEVEGWDAEHDDEHNCEELLVVARLYYQNGSGPRPVPLRPDGAPVGWPWARKWWKPRDPHRDLVRAGALCLAEKDRLARMGTAGLAHRAEHLLELIVEAMERAAKTQTLDGLIDTAARGPFTEAQWKTTPESYRELRRGIVREALGVFGALGFAMVPHKLTEQMAGPLLGHGPHNRPYSPEGAQAKWDTVLEAGDILKIERIL